MFETYIIISNCIITLKQVWTCLKNHIKSYHSIMTSLDMLVESNQLASKVLEFKTCPDMPRHVQTCFAIFGVTRIDMISSNCVI